MWTPSCSKDGANCAADLGETVRYGRRASDLQANPQTLVTSGDYILKQDDGAPGPLARDSAEVIRLFPREAKSVPQRSNGGS
jgi:hypothetical protein